MDFFGGRAVNEEGTSVDQVPPTIEVNNLRDTIVECADTVANLVGAAQSVFVEVVRDPISDTGFGISSRAVTSAKQVFENLASDVEGALQKLVTSVPMESEFDHQLLYALLKKLHPANDDTVASLITSRNLAGPPGVTGSVSPAQQQLVLPDGRVSPSAMPPAVGGGVATWIPSPSSPSLAAPRHQLPRSSAAHEEDFTETVSCRDLMAMVQQRIFELSSQLERSKLLLHLSRRKNRQKMDVVRYLQKTLYNEIITLHDHIFLLTNSGNGGGVSNGSGGLVSQGSFSGSPLGLQQSAPHSIIHPYVFSLLDFLELVEGDAFDGANRGISAEIERHILELPKIEQQPDMREQLSLNVTMIVQMMEKWRKEQSKKLDIGDERALASRELARKFEEEAKDREKQLGELNEKFKKETERFRRDRITLQKLFLTSETNLNYALQKIKELRSEMGDKDKEITGLKAAIVELEAKAKMDEIDRHTKLLEMEENMGVQQARIDVERKRIAKIIQKIMSGATSGLNAILEGDEDEDEEVDPLLADFLRGVGDMKSVQEQLTSLKEQSKGLIDEANTMKLKNDELGALIEIAAFQLKNRGFPVDERLEHFLVERLGPNAMKKSALQEMKWKEEVRRGRALNHLQRCLDEVSVFTEAVTSFAAQIKEVVPEPSAAQSSKKEKPFVAFAEEGDEHGEGETEQQQQPQEQEEQEEEVGTAAADGDRGGKEAAENSTEDREEEEEEEDESTVDDVDGHAMNALISVFPSAMKTLKILSQNMKEKAASDDSKIKQLTSELEQGKKEISRIRGTLAKYEDMGKFRRASRVGCTVIDDRPPDHSEIDEMIAYERYLFELEVRRAQEKEKLKLEGGNLPSASQSISAPASPIKQHPPGEKVAGGGSGGESGTTFPVLMREEGKPQVAEAAVQTREDVIVQTVEEHRSELNYATALAAATSELKAKRQQEEASHAQQEVERRKSATPTTTPSGTPLLPPKTKVIPLVPTENRESQTEILITDEAEFILAPENQELLSQLVAKHQQLASSLPSSPTSGVSTGFAIVLSGGGTDAEVQTDEITVKSPLDVPSDYQSAADVVNKYMSLLESGGIGEFGGGRLRRTGGGAGTHQQQGNLEEVQQAVRDRYYTRMEVERTICSNCGASLKLCELTKRLVAVSETGTLVHQDAFASGTASTSTQTVIIGSKVTMRPKVSTVSVAVVAKPATKDAWLGTQSSSSLPPSPSSMPIAVAKEDVGVQVDLGGGGRGGQRHLSASGFNHWVKPMGDPPFGADFLVWHPDSRVVIPSPIEHTPSEAEEITEHTGDDNLKLNEGGVTASGPVLASGSANRMIAKHRSRFASAGMQRSLERSSLSIGHVRPTSSASKVNASAKVSVTATAKPKPAIDNPPKPSHPPAIEQKKEEGGDHNGSGRPPTAASTFSASGIPPRPHTTSPQKRSQSPPPPIVPPPATAPGQPRDTLAAAKRKQPPAIFFSRCCARSV